MAAGDVDAHYDLIILGTGSGNSIPGEEFDDHSIAIVEEDRFGGTCLNYGCIPTKMFARVADLAYEARTSSHLGIDASVDQVRWNDIQRRVFNDRVDEIARGGEEYRRGDETPNIDVYDGHAVFVAPRTLKTAQGGVEKTISADQVVVAAGSHTVVPPAIANSGVRYRTNKDVMRLETLPERLVIVGGGYIAMEFAHVFDALGTEVTLLVRSNRVLRHLDEDISKRITDIAAERYDVRFGTQVAGLEEAGDGVRVLLEGGDAIEADEVLVATGRRSNAENLHLDAAGIEVTDDGRLAVDEYGRSTSADGVWALGDVSSPHLLKHVANAEQRAVTHNLLHPDDLEKLPHELVPAAVFTHPQIATVGLTEKEAIDKGHDVTVKVQNYGDVAYGWALDDHTGVVKLVADKKTGRLLGAHLLGPEAATLIHQLITAMAFDVPASKLARGQYWIHPALSEVIENALLGLEFDEGAGED